LATGGRGIEQWGEPGRSDPTRAHAVSTEMSAARAYLMVQSKSELVAGVRVTFRLSWTA
jgi:hypothetical protein